MVPPNHPLALPAFAISYYHSVELRQRKEEGAQASGHIPITEVQNLKGMGLSLSIIMTFGCSTLEKSKTLKWIRIKESAMPEPIDSFGILIEICSRTFKNFCLKTAYKWRIVFLSFFFKGKCKKAKHQCPMDVHIGMSLLA